ncbi:hypothetical protein CEUSTIGMA_g10925.t1 [Chlamydomonas eustigma]|uniref:Uncharacterized protein n=1 Tax=Chlamydomonas eustigma TaxID=1157962 RepID=A0A250XL36_9CHLO|nr:hypothetical protein CEUSTIGMA_g10925.t1 [Chlamydomonas eustigma]|eukprot:GAX83500.1 hypothetical protein CEUSTIGMA_g10925.t1 [Chlamydomonas eustigma]
MGRSLSRLSVKSDNSQLLSAVRCDINSFSPVSCKSLKPRISESGWAQQACSNDQRSRFESGHDGHDSNIISPTDVESSEDSEEDLDYGPLPSFNLLPPCFPAKGQSHSSAYLQQSLLGSRRKQEREDPNLQSLGTRLDKKCHTHDHQWGVRGTGKDELADVEGEADFSIALSHNEQQRIQNGYAPVLPAPVGHTATQVVHQNSSHDVHFVHSGDSVDDAALGCLSDEEDPEVPPFTLPSFDLFPITTTSTARSRLIQQGNPGGRRMAPEDSAGHVYPLSDSKHALQKLSEAGPHTVTLNISPVPTFQSSGIYKSCTESLLQPPYSLSIRGHYLANQGFPQSQPHDLKMTAQSPLEANKVLFTTIGHSTQHALGPNSGSPGQGVDLCHGLHFPSQRKRPHASSDGKTEISLDRRDQPLRDGLPNIDQPLRDGLPNIDQPLRDALPNIDQPLRDGLPNIDQPLRDALPNIEQPLRDGLPNIEQPLRDGLPNIEQPLRDGLPIIEQPLRDGLPNIEQPLRDGLPNIEQPLRDGLPNIEQPLRDGLPNIAHDGVAVLRVVSKSVPPSRSSLGSQACQDQSLCRSGQKRFVCFPVGLTPQLGSAASPFILDDGEEGRHPTAEKVQQSKNGGEPCFASRMCRERSARDKSGRRESSAAEDVSTMMAANAPLLPEDKIEDSDSDGLAQRPKPLADRRLSQPFPYSLAAVRGEVCVSNSMRPQPLQVNTACRPSGAVTAGVSVAVTAGVSVAVTAGVSVAVTAGVSVAVTAGVSVAVTAGVSVAVTAGVSVAVTAGVSVAGCSREGTAGVSVAVTAGVSVAGCSREGTAGVSVAVTAGVSVAGCSREGTSSQRIHSSMLDRSNALQGAVNGKLTRAFVIPKMSLPVGRLAAVNAPAEKGTSAAMLSNTAIWPLAGFKSEHPPQPVHSATDCGVNLSAQAGVGPGNVNKDCTAAAAGEPGTTRCTVAGQRLWWNLLPDFIPVRNIDLHEPYIDLHEPYIGLHEPYIGLHEPYIGLHEPYIDLHEPYIDLHEAYIDLHEPYIDLHEANIGLHEPYIDLHEPYIGLHEPYIGLHEAYIDLHEPYIDLHEPYIDLHEPYIGLHEAYSDLHEAYRKLHEAEKVGALLNGIDPRNGHRVHVLYQHQFTSESVGAHQAVAAANERAAIRDGLTFNDATAVQHIISAAGKTQGHSRKRGRNPSRASKLSDSNTGPEQVGKGQWYSSNGVKCYRDEHGKELQGKAAYNAYKGLKSKERKGPKRKRRGNK